MVKKGRPGRVKFQLNFFQVFCRILRCLHEQGIMGNYFYKNLLERKNVLLLQPLRGILFS